MEYVLLAIAALIVLAIVFAVIKTVPDLRRYLRMRGM